MDVEDSPACTNDYVQFQEENYIDHGKFCGSKITALTTSGPNLTVTFSSNEALGGAGFMLAWRTSKSLVIN